MGVRENGGATVGSEGIWEFGNVNKTGPAVVYTKFMQDPGVEFVCPRLAYRRNI